jgi:hypothetical protein
MFQRIGNAPIAAYPNLILKWCKFKLRFFLVRHHDID